MPSHGPTEPPDESHGWEDEYDTIMETVESKAMLTGLGRTENRYDGVDRAATPVETDDDALHAFVQMVYDHGVAHGAHMAADVNAHAALADEFDEQDKALAGEISASTARDLEARGKNLEVIRHDVFGLPGDPEPLPTREFLRVFELGKPESEFQEVPEGQGGVRIRVPDGLQPMEGISEGDTYQETTTLKDADGETLGVVTSFEVVPRTVDMPIYGVGSGPRPVGFVKGLGPNYAISLGHIPEAKHGYDPGESTCRCGDADCEWVF